jgi:hypothetical protein
LTSLCKYGLPTGDLYEFSALTVLRYEKKVKAQRKKELEERMKQRNDNKRSGHDYSPEALERSPEGHRALAGQKSQPRLAIEDIKKPLKIE